MTTENIKELKDFVQNAIDKGATSVEEVHKKIAGMPFEFVAKFRPLQESADQVKSLQDNTIGAIYDAIRLVNAKAGDYAEEILSRHQNDPEGTSEEKV